MEKGKRIEVADLHLPEAIIQHIQSFLNGKEAAQTTLLSKSWNNAWLTRPNLDFDQKLFESSSKSDADADTVKSFWRFVNKTVERYEKLNLHIDSFRLWIHAENSLVNKLIIKALKMGATGLDFKIYCQNSEFALPHQVFGFENLSKLSVSGCKIGRGRDGWVICGRLKSLALESVFVESNIIWDIISSCPLIENLSLSTTPDRLGLTVFGELNVVDGPIFVNEFHKLEMLSLYRINFPPSYFDDFSSKFPCLKVLALNRCQLYKEISISSPSLESINLNFAEYDAMLRLKFDVPRIRKFTFSGAKVPTLWIKTTKSNWESSITFRRQCPPSATWFLELNKFLMSLSKVLFLTLVISSDKTLDTGEFRGVCRPEVQYLGISGPCSTNPALYYALFQCCRPMYVTQSWFAKSYKPSKRRYDFVNFVCNRMAHQAAFSSCLAYQRMMSSGECDLEEVHVQFYDESISKWRYRSQLLDPGDADKLRIRLYLRWRQILKQV